MKKLFALLFISMISGNDNGPRSRRFRALLCLKGRTARRWSIGERIRNRYQHHHRRRRTFYFKKEIPEKAQRIRVKYIGMQPKDVKIRPIMNVTLDLEKNWHFYTSRGWSHGYNLENNNEDIYGGNNHLYIQGGVGLNYNFSTYFFIAAFCQCGGQRL